MSEKTDYAALKVDELQKLLEERELPKSGRKAELIARLEDDDAANPESSVVSRQSSEEPVAEEEAPVEEKPARRRGSAETTAGRRKPAPAGRSTEGALEVRAQARYVRTAPRKARLVMEHIRGKPVDLAIATLRHTPRAASQDILKLLNSAIANAENNHELVADELKVGKAFVDEGPTLKRYRPRALGRATSIRKRTSHMTIILTGKD